MEKIWITSALLAIGCSNQSELLLENYENRLIELQEENRALQLQLDSPQMHCSGVWINPGEAISGSTEEVLTEQQKTVLILRAKEAILIRRDDVVSEELVFNGLEEYTWPHRSVIVKFTQIRKINKEPVSNSHAAVSFIILKDWCPLYQINAVHLLPSR